MSNAKGQKPFLISEQNGRHVVVVEAQNDTEALLRATAVVRILGYSSGNYLWTIRQAGKTEVIQAPFFADGFFKAHGSRLNMSAQIIEMPRAHAN